MIVVTAPTSSIGRQVLEHLLDSDEPIRVIARDPQRLSARTRERVEVVQGSHGHGDIVTRAFAGADTVFWLAPPDPRAESVEAAFVGFTRPACDAFTSQASSGWSGSRPSAAASSPTPGTSLPRWRWTT
jgi:uncharacterized protein YbjT (DUF2867 family)